jgi:nicotinamide mononucleotide (NMN) deamidase PncC
MMKTDYAIATSNAGPSKGDANADLGTVLCIGHSKEIIVEEFNFGNP